MYLFSAAHDDPWILQVLEHAIASMQALDQGIDCVCTWQEIGWLKFGRARV